MGPGPTGGDTPEKIVVPAGHPPEEIVGPAGGHPPEDDPKSNSTATDEQGDQGTGKDVPGIRSVSCGGGVTCIPDRGRYCIFKDGNGVSVEGRVALEPGTNEMRCYFPKAANGPADGLADEPDLSSFTDLGESATATDDASEGKSSLADQGEAEEPAGEPQGSFFTGVGNFFKSISSFFGGLFG